MKIPSEETQERAKRVLDEFVKGAGAIRNEHLEDVEDYYKHYKVQESERTYIGRAHTADPSSHENVETIAPRLFTIITDGGELKFESEPVERGEDDKIAQAINSLVQSDMKVAGGRNKLIEMCRSITKYGTVVIETPWMQYTRMRNEPKYGELVVKGHTADGTLIVKQKLEGYEKIEETYYEGVGWELVDLMQVYLDPIEPDVNKAQAIVREKIVAFADLKKQEIKKTRIPHTTKDGTPILIETMIGHYFNLDDLEEKLNVAVKVDRIGQSESREQDDNTPHPLVNLKIYRGFFDWDDDGEDEECVITLAQNEIIIQCELSTMPRRPYLVGRYIPIEGQTYGLGVLEIMSNVQKVINDLQNQIIDGNTQNLLPRWLLDEDSDLEDKDLVYAPDQVLRVSDTERELVPLRPGNLSGLGYEGVAFLVEKLKSATGASRALTAQPFGTNTTATEVQQNQVEASARIVLTSFVIEEEIIVPWLRNVVEFNHAFMPAEKMLRISKKDAEGGKLLKSISRKDIAAQIDFTPLGATKYQRQQRGRQELSECLQQLAQVFQTPIEIADEYRINLNYFARAIVANYSSLADDADQIFGKAPQKQEELPPPGAGGGNGRPPVEPRLMARFLEGRLR